MFNADANIFKIMGLELTMGRFYSDDLSTDRGKMVVNETFLRQNDITNPVGGEVIAGFSGNRSEIIGVVKDFHFKSVSQPITPLAIINESYSTYCLVSLQTTGFSSLETTVKDIKEVTSALSPDFPVEVGFLDQAVENMYKSELQFRHAFLPFCRMCHSYLLSGYLSYVFVCMSASCKGNWYT